MFRLLGGLVSPAGRRAALVILMYHRVLARPDPILHDEMDAAGFTRQMRMIAGEFNVVPLGEACARLARGELPARALSLTFDDGYADNATIALPILQRMRLRATFFVATGYTGGGVMFNDAIYEAMRCARAGEHDLTRLDEGVLLLDTPVSRRATAERIIDGLKYRHPRERSVLAERILWALEVPAPRGLMMTEEQIRRLHACGMEIGAHTVNHPILARLPDGEAREEIVASKRTLEEITGAPVNVFAYPNGRPGTDYGPAHVRMVREAGYCAAVSTSRGICRSDSDLFQLPRVAPWDENPRRLAVRLIGLYAGRRAQRRRGVAEASLS